MGYVTTVGSTAKALSATVFVVRRDVLDGLKKARSPTSNTPTFPHCPQPPAPRAIPPPPPLPLAPTPCAPRPTASAVVLLLRPPRRPEAHPDAFPPRREATMSALGSAAALSGTRASRRSEREARAPRACSSTARLDAFRKRAASVQLVVRVERVPAGTVSVRAEAAKGSPGSAAASRRRLYGVRDPDGTKM